MVPRRCRLRRRAPQAVKRDKTPKPNHHLLRLRSPGKNQHVAGIIRRKTKAMRKQSTEVGIGWGRPRVVGFMIYRRGGTAGEPRRFRAGDRWWKQASLMGREIGEELTRHTVWCESFQLSSTPFVVVSFTGNGVRPDNAHLFLIIPLSTLS